MPFTTRCPFIDAAIPLTTNWSVQGFARVRRLQNTQVVACAVGLFLFAPVTTFALELGEAAVRSGLGQSLHLEIPYRLAANERLTPGCVGLAPAALAADVLPTYTRVSRISISPTHIEIFDDASVREPLIGLTVDVHCNTVPHLVRSYQLFVDPPARMPTVFSDDTAVATARAQSAIDAAQPLAARQSGAAAAVLDATAAASATGDPTASTPVTRAQRANASPRARGQAGGNLTQGQTYRVIRGDTLSGIAARVVERPTIRQTADAIFAANPEAFTRNNRDSIEEGRSITIPIIPPSAAAVSVAPSAPAALPAVREAEAPAVAPSTANPTSAIASATQPPRAETAASVVAPVAIEPLPAAAPAEPSVEPSAAAPVPTVTSTGLAPDAPSRATAGRTSAWLTALLAVGVVILLAAPLAFVRRRKQLAAAQVGGKVQSPQPRRLADPVAGIDVVEGRLVRASSNHKPASTNSSKAGPVADPGAALPAGLDNLALSIGPTDSVDLDVGVPVMMNERVDWFAERPDPAANDAAAGGETVEEHAATARMPGLDTAATVRQPSPPSKPDLSKRPVDDEPMTLTIVELDLLRQDYEAEHTLTQQGSQALRDAVADLKATKAARDATAETATMELPEQSQAETTASTARLRVK
jgi:hypothetical protein